MINETVQEQKNTLCIDFIQNECSSLIHVQQSVDSTYDLLNDLFVNMDFEIPDKVSSIKEEDLSNEEIGDINHSSVETEQTNSQDYDKDASKYIKRWNLSDKS